MTTKIRIEKVSGVNQVAIDILNGSGKLVDSKLLRADGDFFNTEIHAEQSIGAVRELTVEPAAPEAGPGAARESEGSEDKPTA